MTTTKLRGAKLTPEDPEMTSEKQQTLTSFFTSLEKMESEDMMAMVEKHLKDDDVELFVHHPRSY
jgi:hypothetical protein